MSCTKLVFVGIIASPVSLGVLSVTSGYLSVVNGRIARKGTDLEFNSLKTSGSFADFEIIHLSESQFLLPGLVDCHTHAPQFPNIGVGLDRPLLEWLTTYTFPLESRYSEVQFAALVYNEVIKRLLNNGTTTACYFGSIHLESTLELARAASRLHQRALVGKVSMNVPNEAGYYNSTGKELEDVDIFVKTVLEFKNDLVLPIITPRFALSCDEELMTGLSKISAQYDCRVQSHISENLKEIEEVLKQFPKCCNYGEVYNKNGLLNNKCILAHAVHLNNEEMTLLHDKAVSVAHCPASNTRLKSGLCPVRKLLEKNIKVGLGTDVSGGDNASIMDAMRRTMDVSTHLALQQGSETAIDWKEAIYLATLGGAKALNLDDKIGSFELGKEFDALLIDVYADGGPIDRYQYTLDKTPEEKAMSLVQRFVYLADDRNLLQVYVKGEKVKDISPKGNIDHHSE